MEQIIPFINKSNYTYILSKGADIIDPFKEEKKMEYVHKLSSMDLEEDQFSRLKCPNLVIGFGSNVLTYCKHMNYKCKLLVFHGYDGTLDVIKKDLSEIILTIFNVVIKSEPSFDNILTNSLYI